MLSCRRRHITCAHKALSQWLRLNSTRTACPEDAAVINAAEKALHRGIASEIVEFEIGFDEAVAKFDRYQSSAAKGFQAHGLLTSSQARIGAAYLPFWIFKAKVTAEYRGVLGFKDASNNQMVWKEMEDWSTLAQGEEMTCEPVYASYKYDRQLGSAAALPHDHPSYLEARSLQEGEAHALAAAPGAAGTPPSRVPLSQVAPPQPQQPLSIDSARYGHTHNYMGAQARPQQQRQQPKPSTSEGAPSDKGAAEAVGGGGSGGGEEACSTGPASHGAWQPGQSVDVHPPDMKQAVAWQLGWRSMQAQLTQKATKAAAKDTGAAEVRDVHVSLSVHRRRVRLVYLPVYIAHYQHGYRNKLGTSSVSVPNMFYTAIGGTKNGCVVAPTHVSHWKAQAAAAGVTGSVGPALLNVLPTAPMLVPGMAGTAEAVAMAVVAAALASTWARGLPQAARNTLMATQLRAEREFFRQYDQMETKTTAAVSAAYWGEGGLGEEEAGEEGAGRPKGAQGPLPGSKAGEVADEYMQWLWMDNDWRKWEGEPWNWDERVRWEAAEKVARSVAARRIARQQFVLHSLADRERRAAEMEAEASRMRQGASARRRHRHHHAGHHGTNAGHAVVSRNRDFLGYYRVLGIEKEGAERGEVTTDAVKTAFKAAAMRLHPDRVASEGGDADAQREAHVRFQKLQMAYDVLRDPEKRRAYDRGQLVSH